MSARIVIPQLYAPLFLPNHTAEQAKRFTPEYKAEIRRRLLRGEELSNEEIGLKEFVLKGGRISGKTQNDDYATIPLLVEKEKGDVWVCRSEESTIRRSVFQALQSAIRDLGYTISNRKDTDFRVLTSPFEIIHNKTGNRIQFFAINKDINRTKAMTPPSGRLKKVVLEEANEPDGEIYVEALRSTALRFFDENSKIVYRYNPPPGLNHWANRYYPSLQRRGAILIHSTWEDIANLLDPIIIADILKFKREDPLHYSYWYGGEVISMEGLVIWSFDRNKHLISLAELQGRIRRNIYYQPVQMLYGVDSGIKRDATAVSAWAIYPDGLLIKLGTYFLDIAAYRRKTGAKGLTHTDQARMISEWHNREFIPRMAAWGISIPSSRAERWCFDGAGITQDLMWEFEKIERTSCTAITDKDVERDIARLVNAYRSNQLLILDTEDNRVSIEEMETFARNEENEIPEGQSDHTIDADKYATYEYYYNFM